MWEDGEFLFTVGFLEGRLVEDGLEEKAYLRIGESLRVWEGAAEEECEGETVASTTSLCAFCAAVGLTVGAYVGVTVGVG